MSDDSFDVDITVFFFFCNFGLWMRGLQWIMSWAFCF